MYKSVFVTDVQNEIVIQEILNHLSVRYVTYTKQIMMGCILMATVTYTFME